MTDAPPIVFISYSWDSTEHQEWVIQLATTLRSAGIDVMLDAWDADFGDDLAAFMEKGVRDSDILVMLSLVDQPHFSKDGNIFVNGSTALVSLFTIPEPQRTGLWWIFCIWSIYLILMSFILMAIRSRELFLETRFIQFLSRFN